MQSNYNYADQSAAFWNALPGFLAEYQHPLFNTFNSASNEREHEHGDFPPGPPSPMANPWSWGYQAFGGPGGIPHRGGPPPPAPPPRRNDERDGEKENDEGHTDARDVNVNEDNGEGPSGNTGSDNENQPRHHGRRCGGRRGRCGSPGGRGGFGGPWEHGRHGPGPRHGPHHDHHRSHHGPPHGRRGPRRGNWGPFGGWGGMGVPHGTTLEDLPALATQYWNQFVDNHPSNQRGTANTGNNNNNNDNEDFVPEADIFDTESAFVVHVSLPGAKKEDVGVNWDVEKSELSVAGVIYRPGDEDFLKTLAMNERKVGPFERKIKLGSRDSPAHIDADGVSAKLEDGILRIEAPKMDMGFVEIKKVDIM